MRRKDITENPFKKFQQNIAKGFTATQKGGAVGPDAAEKGIKNFFTDTGKDDEKSKDKDKSDKTKNTVVTKDPADANAPLDKGKPEEPKAEPAAPSKGDDFPVGYAGGEKYKVRPGDIVDYTNAKGQERQAKVTKLLDTRDKNNNLQIGLSLKGALYALDRNKITKVNGKDWKFTESKEKTMNKAIKEGLADLAQKAEHDHEVQMARADLYKIAKYAIKLHDMLKTVSEEEGLEGWQQAKITKASDYISSVYHNLEYDMKFGEGMNEARDTHCSDKCCGSDVKAEDCTCPPTCKHCNCNAVSEGKSPHKKGSAKYKKHMAAKHASMSEDEYKTSISEKLKNKLESIKPTKVEPKQMKAKKVKPDTGGHPTK